MADAAPLPQGRAAWLADNLSGGLKKSLPALALLNQIQAQAPFQTALHHWLDGILCAPNLDYALAHQSDLQGRQSWLTPEGHQVDRISVMLYGQNSGENLIEHKARLDKLEADLATLAPQLASAEQALRQAQSARSAAEQHHKNLQHQQKQHQQQYQAAQTRAAELLARTNQGQIRREHIQRELLQIEEEALILEQTSDGLEDDIAILGEAAAELEQQHHHIGSQRNQQQNQLKQARLALLEANRRYGLAEVDAHKLQQQKQTQQQQLIQLEQQTLDWQERQSELALAYEAEQAQDEQHLKLESLSEAVHTLDEQYAVIQEQLNTTQAQGREQYAAQQSLSAKLPQLQAATQTALLQQQEALLGAEHDVLQHGEAVHQHEMLMHHADAGGDRIAGAARFQGMAVHLDGALVGRVQAVENAHQRRLAGAVLAEQCEHLAAIERERDAVVGGERAEALGEGGEADAGCLDHGSSLRKSGPSREGPLSRIARDECHLVLPADEVQDHTLGEVDDEHRGDDVHQRVDLLRLATDQPDEDVGQEARADADPSGEAWARLLHDHDIIELAGVKMEFFLQR